MTQNTIHVHVIELKIITISVILN